MARARIQTDEQAIARMQASASRHAESLAATDEGFDIELAPLSWWQKNFSDLKVQKLFIENFIRIRSKHDENRLVPFKFNDVQEELHFKRSGRDVVLKARQQGVSTYFLALFLSIAILFSGRNVRLVPHDPDAEEEFWMRLDIMYKNLPASKRPSAKYYSKELMHFEDAALGVTDSRLSSLNPRPGQEEKLRSQTLTHVHVTEIPFWAGDQEKVFTALMAAAEKGEIAIESTAQGKEKFYSFYALGKSGKGGWRSHFFEWWWLRENRIKGYRFAKVQDRWCLLKDDQSSLDIWDVTADTREAKRQNQFRLAEAALDKEEREIAERIATHLKRKEKQYLDANETWTHYSVAEYIAWRRNKIFELGAADKERGRQLFLIEHPENDVDCFDSSALTVISPKYLKVTCDPKGPEPHAEYLIGCDTSLGRDDSDPAAIEIIDIDTGRQCYSESLLIAPDLLAYRLQELSDIYNGAIVCVERNNTGVATLAKLAELIEAERIFKELTEAQKRAVEDNKKTFEEAMRDAELGIATTTANKSLYAVYLEEAIRNEEIGLSSQGWCDEAQTVVWFENNKTWGAMPGFHDDRFIALAIANFVRRQSYGKFRGFVGVMPEAGYAR